MSTPNTPVKSKEERMSDLAPEMHNDEQDDHRSQAQQVAAQAKEHATSGSAPTEGMKVEGTSVDGVAGSETDMIDQMQDMENSGRIDNSAFAGEPNHDDNTSKYGGEAATE